MHTKNGKAHMSIDIFWFFVLCLRGKSQSFFTLLVPTGLLALQGADVPGRLIRNKMNQLNISKDFIQGKNCLSNLINDLHSTKISINNKINIRGQLDFVQGVTLPSLVFLLL